MLINKIGEFGLIDRIKKLIKTDSSVVRGSGDDCAVLKLDKKKYQLFTCDMVVEGVDFTLGDNPYFIGRKAIAVSISDIAACGGIARYCVVSLAMPKNTHIEFIDKVAKGMLDITRKYRVNLVGGDVSRAKQLVIDVSMLGEVNKNNLALRNGAKNGDYIFVSGALGGSIRGRHLRFTPRIKEAGFLVRNFKINSMIDISDGLIQDLGHILKQSKAGAVIYKDLIPLSKQARNFNEALYMGEDYELLFTLSPNEAKRLLKKKISFAKFIGKIVEKKTGIKLVGKNNKEINIYPKGFRHF